MTTKRKGKTCSAAAPQEEEGAAPRDRARSRSHRSPAVAEVALPEVARGWEALAGGEAPVLRAVPDLAQAPPPRAADSEGLRPDWARHVRLPSGAAWVR